MALLKTNTGIGTTNPTSALHVIGDGLFTGIVTAASFSGPINAGVGTFTNLTATNATLTNINSSGISTLGVTSVTHLTAQSINSSGIVTGSTFRPSTGYIQAADGTNSFYIYNSTGNVAFQGTIGASQINNAQGYKVIGFAGTDSTTFENNVYISGITTSVGGFVGNLTGTATTATKLENARTFEITGDVVATAISFDGTGNVSLAATIQPNSVGLGTDTFGDYVRDIIGTANEIEVTGGTGEGSTPQIGLPDDVVITNNLYVGGITTSVGGFVGALTGIAASATKLVTPRTFEITGDVVATAISFDGTGNVSLAATIQPNSVGLGTDTFGDYVRDITGTANEIVVTGGTGEGSTPTLSFPNQVTIPQDLTVLRDVQIDRNLNVTGNITVGGTSGILFTETLKVTDSDLVLGFRTDAFGNDVSNDTTANHGGIAVASTEGNPLVNLNIAGIETLPPTYKKIMWFKAGEFAGLGTDAWLFNYAVGIGSTQFPLGTRLAAGAVQFTENDLAVVRNINASGIITAASFSGNAATASYADVAGIATYATLAGISSYATLAGIASYADVAGIATYATSAGIATYATNAGIASYADVAGIATYATSAGVSTDVIGGIASVTELNVSGVTTVGFITATNAYVAGVVTATTFFGALTGIASTATQLLTPRDFSITGDFVTASAISFDGTGNVALAATITPNSIELGTYTSGNYVASITNGDYITGGDGGTEGAALTIGVAATSANTANQVVARDESGNFSAGTITANLTGTATTASFATTSYYLTDAENILNGTINPSRLTGTYDIDINGNATTADYADVAGIATYATLAGISSYADVTGIATYATSAGIASYADVTGISTYATLAGIASYADVAGIATYATSAGIASYATLSGIASYADVAGIATYATSAGIASYADVAGIATYATSAGIASYADVAGISTYSSLAGIASYADVTGIATYATSAGIASYADVTGISTYATLAGIASYADVAGISTNVIGGIASVTQLSVSGVSTISVNSSSDALRITQLGSGNALVVEDETNPDASPFVVTGIGSIGIGTTNPQYKTHIVDTAATGAGLLVQGGGGGSPIARFERTVGVTGALVDVNASGGDPQIRFHRVGITTFAIGLNQIAGGTDVFEIASSGSLGTNTRFVIDSSNGNVGIGTTNPSSKLQVQGDVSVSGVVTAVGGFNIGIQSGGVSVATDVITALNFVGTGNTFNYNSSTKTIDISISSGVTTSFSRTVNEFTATEGQTSFSVTYTVGYVDVYVNGVYLDSSEYTATDETSVVLDDPANAGDSVIIITYVTGGILVSGVSDRTKTLVIAGAGQTQFNVNYISNNYLDVYLNGSKLNNNEYSANDGTTVGLTTGASLNDELEFVTYNPVYTEAVWSATSPGSGQNGSIYRSSGNVGIGTTVPTAKLHVVGNGKIVGILTASQFAGDGSLLTGIIAQGSGVQIKDDGTLVGTAATFNFINNINATVSSGVAEISISYVDNAGVSTDVIGGIGSITQLNVSGITTTVTLNVLDNSSSDAVRITQLGSGNALVVEDETNPDATPFVVTGIGSVGIGTTNPISKLHVTSEDSEVIRIERTNDNNALIQYTNIVGSMYAGLSPSATGWGVNSDNNLSANPHLLVLRGGGEVLVGSGTSTGTADQKLQVTGGAYVSGFVGIGTTNPTAPLHISGADAANAKIKLEDNDNGFAASEINVANGGRDLRIAAPQDIYFEDLDTNTKTLYIKDGGNVGIGTDDPGAKLNVVDNSSSDALRITQTGSGNALVVEDSTNPDATPFVVRADGKVGVGTTGLIQYSSGVNDTSTFGILAPTGNDSAFVLKGNNGSATDGSGQTLAILVGSTGSAGSGTIITHLSHDTSGIGTRRNAIRFTDSQIRFEDNVTGSVDVTINSSGSGELLVGRTSSTGTSNQLLQVEGGAYVSGSVGIGTTNPTAKLNVVDNSSSDALRITQTGFGNALVVEDSTNPDATPFVVRGDGNVGIGTTNPTNKLEVYGDIGVGTSYNHRIAGQNSNAYNIGFNSTSTLIWGLQTSGGITTTLTITGWGDGNAYIDNRNNGDIYFRNTGNLSNSSALVFKSGGTLLIGSATSTGTANQTLQVHSGGAYFSGSVGIGTTDPNTKLVVTQPTANTVARFESGGTAVNIRFLDSTTTNQVGVGAKGNDFIITMATGGERLRVTSDGNVGIGTTNPIEKLEVVGESCIANRTSYRSAPGDLFSFPGTENDIQFPGQNYEIITVGCGTDVAGSLNNTYFTIYGPGGTSSAIDVTAAEQNVVIWFNVAGAGSTPAVVGAGRSVGIAITSGASAISVGNSITTQMSSDAGFTVATSGDGNVVFVPKTPQNFSNPTVGTAGTVGFAVTTTQDGSGVLSGSNRWLGGVLAPNGKIYAIPYSSTTVLVIDPATNTTSTFGSLSGTNKWIGGVLAPNGKIYGIPYNSTSVLVIDPATNTTSTFGSLSGSAKWIGGVLAPNGKVYGIPHSSTSVLVIDPATNTTSTFGSLSGSAKWYGGVLAPNGKIYGIPRNSTSVLVIDPATNTTSTFGSLSGSDKWIGGVLAPNGKIYGIPYDSTSVLVIDPATNTTSTFGSLSGSNKWYGGVLAPNGKVYGIPHSSTSVLVIDPAVGTATTFGSLSGSAKWAGGVLAPNGKIYGIPYSSTSVLSIGGGSAAIPDWYLSAYQNKL